jgi:hypothetical protein
MTGRVAIAPRRSLLLCGLLLLCGSLLLCGLLLLVACSAATTSRPHTAATGTNVSSANTPQADKEASNDSDAVIPWEEIAKHRVSGPSLSDAPQALRMRVRRRTRGSATSGWRLCIGSGGTVRSVRKLKGSGVREYDDWLERAMLRWRFNVTEEPRIQAPFCTILEIETVQ